METILNFGKIAYSEKAKINLVTVDVLLSGTKAPALSISGTIWNKSKTDSVRCGQCLADIKKYINSPLFDEIYRFWQLYHLNDMHAGTEAQEKMLDNAKITDYFESCNYLRDKGLYIDNGYRFGSGWLYRSIPEADLNRIKEIINNNNR